MNKKLISSIIATTLVVGISVGCIGCSDAKTKQTNNNSNSAISENSKDIITSDKAKEIMLNKVQGGEVTEFSYDKDDSVQKYEGTVIKDNYEYDIDVDAKSGEIISFEKEEIKNGTPTQSKELISEEKAKSIMLEKVPNGTFVKFKLDKDDKPEKYEGELTKDNTEYDISVNAITGEIIEFSSEPIKK